MCTEPDLDVAMQMQAQVLELSCVSMHTMHQARGPRRIATGWHAPYLAERALLAEQLLGVEHRSLPGVNGCDVDVTWMSVRSN